MTYTDQALVAAALKRDLTDREQLSLSVIIPGIQKWLDNKLGTTFLPADPTNHYYDGGDHCIDIESCTDILEIASIDPYTSADYYLYNQNSTTEVLSEPVNGSVKNELRYRNGCFPEGEDNIRVKASFSGYDDGIPEDITNVSTLIAIDMLKLGQIGTDNLKRESLEGHEVMYQDANMMIQSIYTNNPIVASILQLRNEMII